MAAHISDPILGTLTWNGIWLGRLPDTAFGKKVPLHVIVFDDEAKPTTEQRTAFSRYREAEAAIRPEAERLLFKHYEKIKSSLTTRRAVKVTKPADIWKLVKCEAIRVPIQKKKAGAVVMIDVKPSWDAEHGISVFVQGGQGKRLMDPGEGF